MTGVSIGRYRILGELGRGAMGVVYRGLDESLDREVAVKVMSASHAQDEDAKRRFLREGKAAGRLQHPNIVAVYELGEHQGAPYMAMELLDGRDLQQAIKQGLRPNPRVTLPIVMQVLSGLGHAHEHGIVHRDIKPANIFLPRGRPAKIMDFGIARLSTAATGSMTSTGSVVGTPNYMSPEQVRGAELDARSDLFSTGLILYELVTGEKAYQGDSIVSLLFRITQGPPDLTMLPPSPEWARLRGVLHRALAHAPDERYPDARAMESDLALALHDLGGPQDASGAADRGLVRTRVPAAAAAPTVVAPAPEPSWEPTAPAPVPPAAPPSSLPIVLGLGAALLLLVAGGWLAWAFLMQREPPVAVVVSPPTVAPTTAPAPPTTTAVVTPPTVPTALPTPRPTSRPAQPEDVPTPPPATPRPESADAIAARIDKATVLLENGRYAQALAEARAVLARVPGQPEARALAEDAEAAIAVETALKKARELMKKGDDDAALAHVRAGLAVAPADARLLSLFRELNSR